MHVIAVVQHKGGDGKTTLSRLLLEWSARQQIRTLGIDMDAQCNLSARFDVIERTAAGFWEPLPVVHPEFDASDNDEGWDGRSSSADIFTPKGEQFGVTPYPTSNPYIDILPGSGPELANAEKVREEEIKAAIINRLREVLLFPEFQTLYDLVIIDTPPARGPLVFAAMRAASHIVIPCTMEQQSVEGLAGMLQRWRRENRNRTLGQALEIIGILPNKFRHVSLQEGIYAKLRKSPALKDFIIPLELGLRTEIAEVDHPKAKPRSVFDLPDSSKAKTEAEAACKYIFKAAGLVSREPEAIAAQTARQEP